jgi:hypothetical protein
VTERRLLAVLGFLLALIGGILVVVAALQFGRNEALTLEGVARRIVGLVLGIAAVLGGVLMYKGRMSTGGLVTVVIGVLVILVGRGFGVEAVLIVVGGVLGIVGARART